ncbi:PhoU domain-containing protein [Methanohalophilus sp. RSK]|uniref:PhoU domain-containing protein n=1 Tax=Methanohalophilus sp. RSK TaxID=2485783 RepID=UPI0018F2EDCA|nr:PhoU domain-containing protein [Methanohalophilus sp. RSK]
MENEVEPDDPIFKMAEDVQTIFKQSIALLSNLDPMEANMVIKNAKKISREGTELYKNKQSDTNSHQFGFIVESLQKITEYSGDIAEISINMSTKDLNT